ncbi:hypothetical protein HMPREF1613_04141 [Escherichia coli 908616]|uniref:Uncharacterized protein n=2 Tax=Enterobacteriaceae TaxID=543 RepID=Q6XGG3_ECOLX|nr:unknown [Escherichia coli]AHE43779.1 hypothetical protein KP13_31895 [Klebsiella pneumoniae subsp. pneumoniae Kp13]EGF64084.1 hypothetical protein HMPREF9538_01471 [Klebsiella sp. MS 92-3]ESA80026.1 hypothetical protein HMPREF1599_05008 [Escherichia coli 907713]ESA95237.1 hypothetical protein HMPREF1619_05988 [Klebsiella pneumoniae 909957]ESD48634.1 hypothetical protein HMPREF1606_04874 [Escherichia coli 908522]ESD49629.1 hypothetical protein HMPREF1605_03784 [Escherichia coli 908521]ESD8
MQGLLILHAVGTELRVVTTRFRWGPYSVVDYFPPGAQAGPVCRKRQYRASGQYSDRIYRGGERRLRPLSTRYFSHPESPDDFPGQHTRNKQAFS